MPSEESRPKAPRARTARPLVSHGSRGGASCFPSCQTTSFVRAAARWSPIHRGGGDGSHLSSCGLVSRPAFWYRRGAVCPRNRRSVAVKYAFTPFAPDLHALGAEMLGFAGSRAPTSNVAKTPSAQLSDDGGPEIVASPPRPEFAPHLSCGCPSPRLATEIHST